jgi:anaphase-promoting complex subunit 3
MRIPMTSGAVIHTRASWLRFIPHAKTRNTRTFFVVLCAVAFFFVVASEARCCPQDLARDLTLPSSCKEAEDMLKLGREMQRAKNYAKAIDQLQLAHQTCPQDQSISLELIRTYLDARWFPAAESEAKSFLAQHPRSEPGQFFLAYSYFMQQKFQYAGQTLQKLLAQDGKNPDALKLMGLTLFFYKEYVLAEKALNAALELRPQDDEALYYLGRVYYTQNNFPPAIKAFNDLISRNSRNYRAYNNLALCYQAVGKIDEADKAFTKAEQIASQVNPSDDWPYANHADMLAAQGRPDEALRCIQKALQINPRSARNQYILAKVLIDKKDISGAAEHLKLSIQLDPSFAKSHYLLGRVYEQMHERDKAEKEFAQFKELSEKAQSPGGLADRGSDE